MLPYLSYSNQIKLYHGVPHTLDYRNGHRIVTPAPKRDAVASIVTDSDGISYHAATVYGRVKSAPVARFLPEFVRNDKIILTFNGFFRQEVAEPNREKYDLIRKVRIMYFMDDDTMTVIEPPIMNSGYPQGRIIRRSRIIKDPIRNLPYTWKDLNVGVQLKIFGLTFYLTDCDRFTREFLISNGIELNEDPPAPVTVEHRIPKPRPATTSSITRREFKHFDHKKDEGIILCFDCIRLEGNKPWSECITYKFYYFLEDSTVAVKELKKNAEGHSYCPFLLRRTKIRKNSKQIVKYLVSSNENESQTEEDFLKPIDLQVGKDVSVLGHRFLLCDCDTRTRIYYESILKVPQGEKIVIERIRTARPKIELPEYMGFGTPEDSLASVKNLVPREPRKNVIKHLLNANKFLRFGCIMDTIHPDDRDRKFILKFSLADGKISLFEPSIDNSGIQGGMFLSPMLIMRPGCNPNEPDYYTCKDLFIGAVLCVNARRFKIISADTFVYRYMKEHAELFSPEAIEGVRQFLLTIHAVNENENENEDDTK